jgi:hypothetical protein
MQQAAGAEGGVAHDFAFDPQAFLTGEQLIP